jgi:hypothetical protein
MTLRQLPNRRFVIISWRREERQGNRRRFPPKLPYAMTAKKRGHSTFSADRRDAIPPYVLSDAIPTRRDASLKIRAHAVRPYGERIEAPGPSSLAHAVRPYGLARPPEAGKRSRGCPPYSGRREKRGHSTFWADRRDMIPPYAGAMNRAPTSESAQSASSVDRWVRGETETGTFYFLPLVDLAGYDPALRAFGRDPDSSGRVPQDQGARRAPLR